MGAFICTGCRECKPADAFYVRSSGLRRRRCKVCMSSANALNYESNRDRVSARGKARYAEEGDTVRERHREQYQRDRDRVRAKHAEWRKSNPGRCNALSTRHKLRRREQMPSWADPSAVELAYAFARAWSRATGTPHHVDHIVPLNGRGTVSGLHCEANLRIIPAAVNLSKQDRFWPDEVAFPEGRN